MIEYLFTRISAAFGNKIDLYRLGTFYFEGKYVRRDLQKASIYLKKATDKRYTKALYYLGLIELEKTPEEIDYALALRYLLLSRNEEPKAAAKIAEVEAKILSLPATDLHNELLFKIGYMFANDVIVGLDVPKALQFYQLASERGNHFAQVEWAKLLMKSRPGVTKDLPKAKALLEDAALKSFTPAEVALDEFLAKHPEMA